MNINNNKNYDAAIESLKDVPCIICGLPPHSLGIVMPDNQAMLNVQKRKSRVIFFNLCERCSLDKNTASQKAVNIILGNL